MHRSDNSMGRVVLVRTDTPDFAEYGVSFSNLAEMVNICRVPPRNAIVDRIIVCGDVQGAACTVTLSFVSISG